MLTGQAEAWERFAAAALQALVMKMKVVDDYHLYVARQAAMYADAMLKEWEKR